MKITLVPSSVGTRAVDSRCFLASYLINDTVALDAGCLGFYGEATEQARRHHRLCVGLRPAQTHGVAEAIAVG